MNTAMVVAIYLHGENAGPMIPVSETQAEAGLGLVGDTYHRIMAERVARRSPDREVTLIEQEAIYFLQETQSIHLDASESRRNLITQGISLNELVGAEFQVGEVRLRGVRLCDPCKHLEQLTKPGVLKGLKDRGGLRAEILVSGTIRVGQEIIVPSSPRS